MMAAYLEYPLSKGSLHINSKDPFAAPDFDAGFLTDEADMVRGLQVSLKKEFLTKALVKRRLTSGCTKCKSSNCFIMMPC